jgi:hypothetical protein
MKQFRICILVLAMSILSIGCTTAIREDKLYVIDDVEKVQQMMEEHTPIRLEVQSIRWGKGVITNQKMIHQVWNQIHQMSQIDQSAYIPQEDDLIGTAHFLDGRKLSFSIGERYMQIGYRYYGSNEGNVELRTIYSKLKEAIYTVQNLQTLISNAAIIVMYPANLTRGEGIYLTEKQVEKLQKDLDAAIVISDIQTLKSMYKESIMAQYRIEIWLDEPELTEDAISQSKDMVLITVYSPEYFTVWDMQQEGTRNIVHIQGNLFDFSAVNYHKK